MPGNILFALSLCRKAGALVMGFDAVKDSVGKGKAQLVLCAGDLSEARAAASAPSVRIGWRWRTCPKPSSPSHRLAKNPPAYSP